MMGVIFSKFKLIIKESPMIYHDALNMIKSFNKNTDHENGLRYLKFIERNMKLREPFNIFILFDSEDKRVLGIASLVHDDQNAGKEKKLEGMWIAGVIIRSEFRNKGFGDLLFKNIDNYLRNLVIKPFRVNLFSDNKFAIKIYKKYGFLNTKLKLKRSGRNMEIFSKYYN